MKISNSFAFKADIIMAEHYGIVAITATTSGILLLFQTLLSSKKFSNVNKI